MKKWFKILVSVLFTVCLCLALAACGDFFSYGGSNGGNNNSGSSSSGNNSQPKEESDGTFIYSGASIKAASTSISGDVVIPTSHNGTTIDTIPKDAFKSCNGITSVVVPESITSIGSGAFNGCSSIRSITLPFVGSQKGNSSEKSACFGYIFGTSSYQGGTRISQHYSSSVSSYEYYYIPSTLRSVTITNETVLGYGAFQNCSMLQSITINSGASSNVGTKAFENTAIPTWN